MSITFLHIFLFENFSQQTIRRVDTDIIRIRGQECESTYEMSLIFVFFSGNQRSVSTVTFFRIISLLLVLAIHRIIKKYSTP